jgi:uncharacterized protein with PhoU and TrkA domain
MSSMMDLEMKWVIHGEEMLEKEVWKLHERIKEIQLRVNGIMLTNTRKEGVSSLPEVQA